MILPFLVNILSIFDNIYQYLQIFINIRYCVPTYLPTYLPTYCLLPTAYCKSENLTVVVEFTPKHLKQLMIFPDRSEHRPEIDHGQQNDYDYTRVYIYVHTYVHYICTHVAHINIYIYIYTHTCTHHMQNMKWHTVNQIKHETSTCNL